MRTRACVRVRARARVQVSARTRACVRACLSNVRFPKANIVLEAPHLKKEKKREEDQLHYGNGILIPQDLQ